MNLREFDHIVLNTSGGKDSQAMMHEIAWLAHWQGVSDRLVAVHADLGQVEWQGSRELVEEQCQSYDIPLHIVRREQGDLLAQVEARGMWPSATNRFCTSDQKRDQIAKVIRHLPGSRVLNCLGFRAEESTARAARVPISTDKRLSNSRRTVTVWLPLHAWTAARVWETIHTSGVRFADAYRLGMPRYSCVFCIFASREALLVAGKHNRPLLDRYVATEKKTGHDFRKGFKIASIAEALDAGEEPAAVPDWVM